MIPSVLLVDDDVELVGLLADYLRQDGFRTSMAHDGESAVAAALSQQHDIVVLDVMMPRLTGIEVLRRLRAQSRIPVLMLTARGDDIDRVLGLELGADDYVPKPCSPRELAARLRAILRRLHPVAEEAGGPPALRVGAGVLWPARRSAEWAGQPLSLTGAEFNLLAELMRQAGRLVTKAELSERALGRPLARFDRSIDVHISAIRQKLASCQPGADPIRTVRGMGYQLTRD
ncbi:response regulator [Ideonella azotifigens]|uniref:Response regulator n=3 Tax=Ideonella azotifigens TaxID=513160 RepID=A0ABN1KKK9_9BURK